MHIRTVYPILMISLFLLFPAMAFPMDFYEFNDYLGLCPVSKTLTQISDRGSYLATVQDSDKFAKICPRIENGKRVLMHKLDPDHWLIRIDASEIQFRFEDLGYAPTRGGRFRLTKLCDTCPSRPARSPAAATADDAGRGSAGAPGSGEEPQKYVIFDFDKDIVKPPYFYVINEIIKDLKADPSAKVTINGHTCSIGPKKYNLTLSQKRALAVKRYMIQKGIAANRIVTQGFGYDKPFAGNGTADGRSQNRRVEFMLR